jgi:ribosomal protein S21
MSVKNSKTGEQPEYLWYDNPMVVVEDNDLYRALHNLRRRKSDFGIIKKERRRRYTHAQQAKRHKRIIAELKKQRIWHRIH